MEGGETEERENGNSSDVDGAEAFSVGGIMDSLDGFETGDVGSDVDLLRRVWRNEKCAPEILPYEASLVGRVREQIQLMEENIEAFATEIKDDLMLSLYRMDVNRTLFLLRSYLRARLIKIERHPIHIIDNQELWDRLSEHEQEYTNKHCENLAKHFEQTVLIRLPDQYGSMLKQTSLATEENDMIMQPQLNTFVFCRSRGSIGSFQLDDKGDEAVDLMADDLYILSDLLRGDLPPFSKYSALFPRCDELIARKLLRSPKDGYEAYSHYLWFDLCSNHHGVVRSAEYDMQGYKLRKL